MKVFLPMMLLLVVGCANTRYVAIPKVNDNGVSVETQYKYRLSDYKVKSKSVKFDTIKNSLERNFPNVFSDDGIPVAISENNVREFKQNYQWTALLFLGSAFTLPIVTEDEKQKEFHVEVLNNEGEKGNYDIYFGKGSAISFFSPLGCLFWNGTPDGEGYRCYSETVFNEAQDSDCRFEVNRLAIGYGAAVKLKELEIAGKIDPEKLKRQPSPVVQPSIQPAVVKQPEVSSPASDVKVVPDKAIAPVSPTPAVSNPVQMFEMESISL